MGATNTTTHYNLSQFVSTDKPAWLQDYNGDMAKIDAGIDEAKVSADTAQNTANAAASASTQNTNDITALSTTVSAQGNNITSLQSNVNTINSLIGNGTPTTTDQTLIGAINELHADFISGGTNITAIAQNQTGNYTASKATLDNYKYLLITLGTSSSYQNVLALIPVAFYRMFVGITVNTPQWPDGNSYVAGTAQNDGSIIFGRSSATYQYNIYGIN